MVIKIYELDDLSDGPHLLYLAPPPPVANSTHRRPSREAESREIERELIAIDEQRKMVKENAQSLPQAAETLQQLDSIAATFTTTLALINSE